MYEGARSEAARPPRPRWAHGAGTAAADTALTVMHYPPLVAAVRAGASGAGATSTPGDAPGGDAAATGAHAQGGADGRAVA